MKPKKKKVGRKTVADKKVNTYVRQSLIKRAEKVGGIDMILEKELPKYENG